MTDLAQLISTLSPERRALLERLRRERAAQAAPRGAVAPLSKPFSLIRAADRLRLPEGVEDAYPLTLMQAGMLYHMELTPEYPLYHNVNSWFLRASFDLRAFQEAVRRVVARHPVLRTSFEMTRYSEPLQLVHAAVDLPVGFADLRELAPERQEEVIRAYVDQERVRAFDRMVPPLLRFFVHLRGDDRFQVTLTEFHPILDGWSLQSTLLEILRTFDALKKGRELPPVRPLTATFRDYVALERQVLASKVAEDFWRSQLAGSTVMSLPRWPSSWRSRGGRPFALQVVDAPPRVFAGLKDLARRLEIPLKSLFLTAHVKVMGLLGGQRDVLTGLTVQGRPELEGGDEIRGLFFNTVPVRLPLQPGTWADLARRAFELEREIVPYRRYPLAEIQRRHGNRSLFEVAFNITHFHVYEGLGPSEIDFEVLGGHGYEDNHFTLYTTFNLDPQSTRLRILLECRRDELADPQIAALGRYYLAALEAMVEHPFAAHDERPLLPAEERHRLLVESNSPVRPVSTDRFHRRILERARLAPEAVAVGAGAETLTAGELAHRVGRLAGLLKGRGVGPEARVGVCLERSTDLVVALLAILEAGGTYVPLDPSHPLERRELILGDSGAQLLLTQSSLAAGLRREGIEALCLDTSWSETSLLQAPVLPEPPPGALAYVMYTSGSTGQPKGVEIPRGAVDNFLAAMERELSLGPGDVWLAVTTVAFDISVLEIFLPLLSGARVELVPREVAVDGPRLIEAIERSGATVLQATPATWQLLEEAGWPGRPGLRILCGGEALPRDLAQVLLQRGAAVWNLYGPTEATVWATVERVAPGERPVPIGRPIDGLGIRVLDDGLLPAPIGVPGELYLTGAGLARGYSGRPDLTAERFVPDPWGDLPGARLYRTGDLARILPTGAIEFLGRNDHQVKLRGFRIELGEIEHALRRHPRVRQAVVVARHEAQGALLAAYVVGEEGMPAGELRDHLRSQLPDYMIPATFVRLVELPLTPNGKVDRRALPAPDWAGGEAGAGYSTPETPIEEILAGLWKQVLGVERVGREDDFFLLGGHSILGTQLVLRIREAFQVDLPLQALFEAPTLAGLAERVAAAAREGAAPPAPPIERMPRTGSLPLSFGQEQLWFVRQLEPDDPSYNIPLAVRLDGLLAIPVLAASLTEVVRRHEVLRTAFRWSNEGPVQVVLPPEPVPLPQVDLSGLAEERAAAESLRLAGEEARRALDLGSGRPIRATLLGLALDRHALLLTLDHAVSDLWSMNVLVREMTTLYEALRQGRPSPFPPLPVQYADFALWQRRWLSGEGLARLLRFWRERLQGRRPELRLQIARPRPEVETSLGAILPFGLSPETSGALRALSAAEGATAFMTLLAAFKALLRFYGGGDDLVVGSPVANRTRRELEGMIGFFVNTLVLRSDLSGNPTFRELLRRVRATCLGAYAHQDLPFERLVSALQPERTGRTPLFQVAFTLQNVATAEARAEGMTFRSMPASTGTSPFDLVMDLVDAPEAFRGSLQFRTDVYSESAVARMIEAWKDLVEAVVGDPDRTLEALAETLGEAERRRRSERGRDIGRKGIQRLGQVQRRGIALESSGTVPAEQDIQS